MDAAEQREEGKDERRARRGSKGRDDSQRERRMLNKGSRRAGKDAVASTSGGESDEYVQSISWSGDFADDDDDSIPFPSNLPTSESGVLDHLSEVGAGIYGEVVSEWVRVRVRVRVRGE